MLAHPDFPSSEWHMEWHRRFDRTLIDLVMSFSPFAKRETTERFSRQTCETTKRKSKISSEKLRTDSQPALHDLSDNLTVPLVPVG